MRSCAFCRLQQWGAIGWLAASVASIVNCGCGSKGSAPQNSGSTATSTASLDNALEEIRKRNAQYEQPFAEEHWENPWEDYSPTALPTFPDVVLANGEDNRFTQLAELKGHDARVTCIAVTPDAQRAASCDESGRLIFWDLTTPSPIASHDLSDHCPLVALAISSDSKVALVAGTQRISKWDIHRGERTGELGKPSDAFLGVAFSPDPNIAAVVDGNTLAFVAVPPMEIFNSVQMPRRKDRGARSNIFPVGKQQEDPVRLRFVNNGTGVLALRGSRLEFYGDDKSNPAYATEGPRATRLFRHMWDVVDPIWSGYEVVDYESYLNDPLVLLAYGDGAIAGVPIDPRVFVQQRMTEEDFQRRYRRVFGRPTNVRDMAFLPGGILAAYGGGESLDFFNSTGQKVGGRFAGNCTGVSAAVVCPDGRRALSGYDDGRVVMYQLPLPLLTADPRWSSLFQELHAALVASRFDELEKTGAELRAARRISNKLKPEYALYYDYLSEPEERTELEWTKLFRRLDEWLAAKPDSTYARVALANAYHGHAWEARGAGFASQVTAQGFERFSERLKKASQYVLEAQELTPDDPAIYDVGIRVAQGLSSGKEPLEKMFEAGFKADPTYYPLYTSMAVCLLPRWYGEPEDLPEFLNDVVDDVKGDEGLAIYALVMGEMKCFHSGGQMSLLGLDMEKLHAGARILMERHPYSMPAFNLACWSACEQRDRARARDFFGWIGDQCDVRYWGSRATYERIRRWAMDGRQLPEQERCILASFQALSALAFSPDGKQVAVGGAEKLQQVTIWDVDTGRQSAALPHAESVRSVEFSPDGKQLATAGGSDAAAQLLIWSLGDEYHMRELEGPLGTVYCARFSPDGKRLASGGDEKTIWVWRLEAEKGDPLKLELPEKIRAVDFSADGSQLVVATEKLAAVLSVAQGDALDGVTTPGVQFTDARFLNDAIVVSGSPYELTRYPADKSKPRGFQTSVRDRQNLFVRSIDVSPDGRLLAVTLNPLVASGEPQSSEIMLLSTESEKEIARWPAHLSVTAAVRFSPDGKRLASVGWDGTLRFWKVPATPAEDAPTR